MGGKILNIKGEKLIVLPAAGTERPLLQPTKNKKFTILSIGRLVALKGFDITLDAFAKFYQALPKSEQEKVQLILIGKGPQKKLLDQRIEQYKLPLNSILSYDWMDRAALTEYYNAAQVFFFPSHEGAGMVVPEALSYGLPVLCFDNVGPGELMNKDCGTE